MRFNTYTDFITESMRSGVKSLVRAIDGEPVPFSTICGKDVPRSSLDSLLDNSEFLKAIADKNLWCGTIMNTDDIDTLASKRIRFALVHKDGQTELDNPEYILIQHHLGTRWHNVKVYKVNGHIDKFFSRLSRRTIELRDKKSTYIYTTNNSGNNWELRNREKENATFKKVLSAKELKEIRKSGVELNYIN